ncbi:hypothetical protein POTOM_052538 [Populus tomentosa]|uniref:Uncharacterized protein n=1 Tax=Populus tomentosa TaxID=118781 RepID=A0A8X7Y5E8_POPTO|nr:hypothetical protein POTOM_052538 [Populus tomentosa]
MTSIEQSLLQPRGCTLKSILNSPMNPIFCWLSATVSLAFDLSTFVGITSSVKQIVHLEILIAQKTAKRVSIQNSGKFQRRQVTGCKENQVIYYGKDLKRS